MTMQGGVRVRITGDDSNLQSTLRSSGVAIAKWGAAAAAAAAAAGAALVTAGMRSADEQAKLARQLNTTTDALQRTNRAAQLAGVSSSQLESATRNLNTRLGTAIQGSGSAADAFARLGLQAQEVADLPLDQRIQTINEALRENVPAAERAAIASDLFGSRAGAAISQISGDDIARATQELNRFGGALTDVDAAKIEAANDSLSQIGVGFQGLTQQLAVQFSPVLQGIADELGTLIDEHDFLSNIAERAFDLIIKGAGFAGDAFRGLQITVGAIRVAFAALRLGAVQTFLGITRAWDDAKKSISEGINDLIDQINKIPGVEIDKIIPEPSQATQRLQQLVQGAQASLGDAASQLEELFTMPLPSENLNNWVAGVKDAAERAAQEVVAAREAMDIPALPGTEDDSEQQQQQSEDLEKLREQLAGRIQAIRESHMSELELLQHREQEKRDLLDQALRIDEITAEDHQAMLNRIEQDGAEARLAIADREAKARRAILTESLSNLATLMQTGSRELFAIGKAAALSEAIINGQAAVTASYRRGSNIGGPVVGAAFAATAAAATGAQISRLASTSFGSGSGGQPTTGGGGTASTAQAQAAPQAGGQTQSLLVQGDFTQDQLFTGTTVRKLIESIAEQQRDGFTVVI